MVITRDVTDRKRMENSLKSERDRFVSILDSMTDGVYIVNQQYGIEYANPAMQREFGPFEGRKCHEYLAGAGEPCSWCKWPEILAGNTIRTEWMCPRNGKIYDSIDTPFQNPDGTVSKLKIIRDITERKRMEEALRESQKDLNRAQAVAHTGSWRLDVRRNLLLWSDENHRIFGIPRGTPMTYETFLSTVHPEDREYVDQQWQAGLHGKPYDIEHRIVVDGQVKWVRERAELEFDHEGTLLGGFGTTEDITERKQREDEIFKLNQRLRAMMEAVPVGISFSDDPTCRRIKGNPAVLAQFEVTSEENLSASASETEAHGRWIRYFRDGREISNIDLPLQRAVAENKIIKPTELEVHLPSGRRWFAETSGAPVHDAQGEVMGGIAVTVDITERKRMEQALHESHEALERKVQERTAELREVIEKLQEEMTERKEAQKAQEESEARYRALFEDSRDPVYVVRRDGTFVDFNRAMVDMFWYSREELMDKNIRDLYVDPDERPWFQKSIERRGSVRDYGIRFRRKNGRVRECLITASLRRAEDGTIQGYQGIIRDTTRHKRDERRLRESGEKLRRLSQKLLQVQEQERRLLARDLHDSIGGSLSAIKFSLARKLNQMNAGESSPRIRLEDIISMVQGAIDESRRISTNLRPSILDDLGVVDTIDWFCGEFEGVYPHIRIEKKVEIEESEVPEHLKIITFRICQEALNNIAKHSGGNLALISLTRGNSSLKLAIIDNGQGFDTKRLVAQEVRGGIGVPGMRERVELSGGTFSIKSKPGGGTTVRARWPIDN
jgi:PAS domain S-box-containing protein